MLFIILDWLSLKTKIPFVPSSLLTLVRAEDKKKETLIPPSEKQYSYLL